MNKVDFLSFDLSVMNGSSSVRCKAKRGRSQGDGVRGARVFAFVSLARPVFHVFTLRILGHVPRRVLTYRFFLCVCAKAQAAYLHCRGMVLGSF